MTGLVAVLAVGALVAFVLARGHATRILYELRLDYSNLVAEERHLRVELEQAVVLQASAERRHDQAKSDRQKLTVELEEMAEDMAEIEDQLKKPGARGEGDKPQDAEPDAR